MDIATIRSALVRFRTAADAVVGVGFLVTERHVLTCAHVVNSALVLTRNARDWPQEPVRLDFPYLDAARVEAQVVRWFFKPPDHHTDIALLEIQPPPGARPLILTAEERDWWGQEARTLGFPAGYPDGVYSEGVFREQQAGELLQLDASPTTQFFVEEGFSGAPVWDVQYRCVGMIVAVAHVRTAFLIPAFTLSRLIAPHISLPDANTTPPPCDDFTWEPGAAFENYTLRVLLGTGGNGQVWLADEHLPDGPPRTVAIKVLRESISQNPTRAARFRREISTMARIDHLHIVPVYTYGECSRQLYVVMPCLKGGTLRARLTGQPLPETDALRLLEQIGAALDYVHDKYGLIHRDVKPENMLFSEDGETLSLSDFGLVFSPEGEDRLTDDGKPAGTGRYMAPEQWQNKTLTRQTDLYALGILAYELLTGHLPFQHTNDVDLGHAHCYQDLPPDPSLPDEVLLILRRAAAKQPGERYPTARVFLTDLRNWRVDPANLEPRIRDYLQWVTEELYEGVRAQFVELTGLETAQRLLPARPKMSAWEDPDDLFARASATIHADHISPEDETRPAFVEQVRERLLTLDLAVLVGEPGSGKTWMLKRLQADYARAWLKQTGEGRGLIPVLVSLNQYTGGPFEAVVKTALDTLAPYHDQLRREGRLVLLCDALNEMPRGAGQMRELIAYLKETPHFIVSCRVRDYRDDLGELKPLEQVLLRDLDLPAIRELVHKRLPGNLGPALWQQMGGSDELVRFWQEVNEKQEGERFWEAQQGVPSYTSGTEDSAWRMMHQGARLIPTARSPYMGDLLCRLYQEAGSLPDSRATLFRQFVDQMLAREARTAARRGETFSDTADIEAALVALARALQKAAQTVITQAEALNAVGRADGEALLRAATDANILGRDGDSLKFTHQLLQEYFAVQILLEALETGQSPAQFFGADWWDAGVWRETTVILGELLGEGARGANTVARWLAPVSPEVALQVITRSGTGLTLADVESATRDRLVEEAHSRQDEKNPVGRAAAYRVLGLLDADNRLGVGLRENGLPDIVWSEPVKAGRFQMGGDPEAPDYGGKWGGALFNLKYPFWVARYPVTYAQYEAFIAAGGYQEQKYWTKAGWTWKEEKTQPEYGWNDPQWHIANHPVIGVTWYEAYAFTQWLDDLRQHGQLALPPGAPENYVLRLPTEAEWEKAARYPDGSTFPWGDDPDVAKLNCAESGIRRTSAAGIFPSRAGSTGAYDLSGNVWEWCLSEWNEKYHFPEKNDSEGDAARVLRGGSWGSSIGNARCACRLRFLPDRRSGYVGFRVVCSAPM